MKVRASLHGIVSGLVLVALFSPAAMASKARLKALSQPLNGSLFVKDERNIFLNPASVNDLENAASFDWGTKTATVTAGGAPAAGQAPNDPNPEGELIFKTDNLNFGLGLGRTGDTTNAMIGAKALGLFTATPFLPQTALDLVVGGGAGEMKWGGGMHYARTTQDTGTPANYPKNTARELNVSGGVVAHKFSAYANLSVIGESTTETSAAVKQKFDGKFGGEVGGKFDIDQASAVGGAVARNSFGFDNGAGGTGDLTLQAVGVNYFRLLPTKAGSTFFGVIGLTWMEIKIDATTAALSKTYNTLMTPVGLGFEHKALSWLDLRASVTQNVLLDQQKTTDGNNEVQLYNPESTKVAAGFSAHAGDTVTFDATFSGATGGGTFNGANLAGDVAMIYKF